VTAFLNRLSNLIEFDSPSRRSINVSRARTSGPELATDVELSEGLLRLKGAYPTSRPKMSRSAELATGS
jgi:outer membrane cobalamin receptor